MFRSFLFCIQSETALQSFQKSPGHISIPNQFPGIRSFDRKNNNNECDYNLDLRVRTFPDRNCERDYVSSRERIAEQSIQNVT